MATIHKLTKDGSTIFPATITDAIVHPNTGKTLTSMIKDYNVSELFPSEGLDGGNKYNLALAIQVLGTHLTAAEKTGGIKITFISSISPYPEEEYYLNKNVWSTTLSDWGQRFEVGGVIADPSGSWEPGTAEEYIDQQTAILTSNLAAETIGRQTVDSNLQTQINSEVSTRTTIDNTQNGRLGVLEEAYRNLTESDVIVGPRPTTGQLPNVIYREPDQGHTPPQFYCDYMWYGDPTPDWVLMAQYDNGIDDNPLPTSNNLVKSKGVFNSMGAYDISADHNGQIYPDLATALNAVPSGMHAGGMSVKFIQEITPAQYTVVRTPDLTTQPTGTALSTDPNIVSGTYSAAQLNNLNTASALPSTLNSSKTYYLEVSTGNYTSWVVTYVHTSDNKYVQYMLKKQTFSLSTVDWQQCDVVNTSNQLDSDLDISDDNSNVLVRFQGGGIKTKNFDSSKAPSIGDATADLDISDEYGNVIVRFKNGNIETKNFDSSEQNSAIKKFKNKSLAIIGDSISTFEGWLPSDIPDYSGATYSSYYPGGDVNTVEKTWWYKVCQTFGIDVYTKLNNCSWSGSKVSGNSDSTTSAAAGCSDRRVSDVAIRGFNPDIIICFMGHNDWILNVPVGTWRVSDSIPSGGNISEFRGAYALMLNKLHISYPHARIFCCTILDDFKKDETPGWPSNNASNISTHEWNQNIKEIAEAFGCDVIDMHACGINYSNIANYYSIDSGLHPNAAGHTLMASKVMTELISKY